MAPSISTLMLQIRTIRARDSRVRAHNKSRSFARNSPSATAISDGAAHNIQIVATYVSNCSSASSADIPAAVIYCSIWIMRMRATKLATQFASAFFFLCWFWASVVVILIHAGQHTQYAVKSLGLRYLFGAHRRSFAYCTSAEYAQSRFGAHRAISNYDKRVDSIFFSFCLLCGAVIAAEFPFVIHSFIGSDSIFKAYHYNRFS